MPLASFLDKPGVVPGILVGWVFFIFLVKVFRPRGWRDRPLGIWLIVGLFALAFLLVFADWLIDDAF